MRKKLFTFLLALAASVGLMNAAVDGKLSGAFTVNAGGDQVYFSQGNLQYQASTNTWRFAEHQYDFIGDAAGNNTESGRNTQSDWIDLFGWATSGNSASGTAYQPWQSSTTDSEYGPAITSGQWTYANSDWGINPISNGGNVANSWRTLTQEEWDYILNGRATENRFCYAKLTIGYGLGYGLIILPDDWDPSYYALSAESMNQGSHSYDSNEITAEDWTNSLEAHGAVFLPVTGIRYNGNVVTGLNDDKIGFYWSSIAAERHEVREEPEPMQVDIVNAAYNLAFNGGWFISTNQVTTRSRGLAVRLVYTEPSGSSTPTPKYFYMEVEGTAGTLKYGDKGSNPYYYESGAWNEGAFKSSITAITVDASCQNFDGTSLQSLFNSFFSLTSISGLENINTANVTNMQNTFSGNEQLTSLDLSSWNTANLENMLAIFFHCDKLVTLDISSWNTANVTNMNSAFAMCPKLEHIYVGDEWSTASASSNTGMFTNCQKLPNYNEDVVDKTKAYAGEGGYLDYKAGSTPDPTPSATGGIFANCYDCQRDPSYPNISGQCYLHGFANPEVGNNNPSGPWKLEFVEYYNSSSTEYESYIASSYAANQYGKSLEQMEVYRLYQWQNGAYQPVAYGVLYAYANENNTAEHSAFFEADGWLGCYLTDKTHSDGDNVYVTFDEDASTGFADLHNGGGSTPTPSTPETSDNVNGIEEYIADLIGGGTTDLIINRTMYKDGYFNTLCLPFSMNASEIAASCLAGCELFEFESATANGGGLDLYIAEADAIVAGKPYLIRWASGENLTSLSFTGVTITASTGQAVGEGVQFVGTIGRTQLENGNENHLFLGANNTLYWPNTNNKLKGFRAYFLVSGDVAPHGAPARVVVRPKTPTGIENANVNAKAVKLLRDGQLFIIKNGVKYNAQGQIVK